MASRWNQLFKFTDNPFGNSIKKGHCAPTDCAIWNSAWTWKYYWCSIISESDTRQTWPKGSYFPMHQLAKMVENSMIAIRCTISLKFNFQFFYRFPWNCRFCKKIWKCSTSLAKTTVGVATWTTPWRTKWCMAATKVFRMLLYSILSSSHGIRAFPKPILSRCDHQYWSLLVRKINIYFRNSPSYGFANFFKCTPRINDVAEVFVGGKRVEIPNTL